MDFKEVKKVIQELGQKVVSRSRYELTKTGVKKGNLYNSLKYDITNIPEGLRLTWYMADYGMFLDAGVYGSYPQAADTYEYKWDRNSKKWVESLNDFKYGAYVKDMSKPKYKGKQKGKQTNSVFTTGAGAVASRFSYKGLRPPVSALRKYIKENNIRFRNPKGKSDGGQYRGGGVDTIAYWMQNRIWAQGITPTLFFTKAFRPAWAKFPKEIQETFEIKLQSIFEKSDIIKKA